MKALLTLLPKLTRYLPQILAVAVLFTLAGYIYILRLQVESCQEDARRAELETAAIYSEALAAALERQQQQYDAALAVLQRQRATERRLRKTAEEKANQILKSQDPETRGWLDSNLPGTVVDGLRELPTYPNGNSSGLYNPANTGRSSDASDPAIPVRKHEWRSAGGIHARVVGHSSREPTTLEATGILRQFRIFCTANPGRSIIAHVGEITWQITCPNQV